MRLILLGTVLHVDRHHKCLGRSPRTAEISSDALLYTYRLWPSLYLPRRSIAETFLAIRIISWNSECSRFHLLPHLPYDAQNSRESCCSQARNKGPCLTQNHAVPL